MADTKYWTHLKLKNGDTVKFVPPSPDGDRLGGITETEKNKLSGIEQQATKTIIDSQLSENSNNPVQNNIINAALNNKININQGSTNAGKVLNVDSNGNVGLTTLSAVTLTQQQDETGGTLTDALVTGIDNTLTLNNYAADAKTVGDKLEIINGDISDLEDCVESGTHTLIYAALRNVYVNGSSIKQASAAESAYFRVVKGVTYSWNASGANRSNVVFTLDIPKIGDTSDYVYAYGADVEFSAPISGYCTVYFYNASSDEVAASFSAIRHVKKLDEVVHEYGLKQVSNRNLELSIESDNLIDIYNFTTSYYLAWSEYVPYHSGELLYSACVYLDGAVKNPVVGTLYFYDANKNQLGASDFSSLGASTNSRSFTNDSVAYCRLRLSTGVATIHFTTDNLIQCYRIYLGYNQVTWNNESDTYGRYVLPTPAEDRLGMVYAKDGTDEDYQCIVEKSGNLYLDADAGIPNFYRDYLNSRIDDITEKNLLIGCNGDAFVFITDLHHNNNYYSPYMAKKICSKTSVNRIIYGGDYVNEPSSKMLAIEQMTTRRDKCRVMDDVVFLRGNHDTNPYGTGQLTVSEYYVLFDKHIEKYINTNRQTYFYQDNTPQKIRYFFLDSGEEGMLDTAQAQWLSDNAALLESTWTVVAFVHMGIHNSDIVDDRINISDYTSMTQIRSALNGITAKVACVICGHVHIDLQDTTTSSYPVISTTCDAHGVQSTTNTTDDRTEGTINEQAFDVFHIDTLNKKIYVTRIGGGQNNVTSGTDYTLNDRVFSYA